MPKQENTITTIQDTAITIAKINSEDYISLTDMAKLKNAEIPATVISHWMSTNYTMNFMGVWEKMHN
ncbi:MAG TPA: DNA-binding protein, partial [Coriobacteriia bacterium]|nr:DNA-binding protein [Coriobacteriia bacterium]